MHGDKKTFVILQCRNYGDAVIGTGLIEALGRSFSGLKMAVFTRPHFRSIYANNPFVDEIYTADFPIGTYKKLHFRPLIDFMRQVIRLRRKKYALAVNCLGDFRENLIGWMICPDGNACPVWPKRHPFRAIVRQGLSFLASRTIEMELCHKGLYDIQTRISRDMGAEIDAHPRLYDVKGVRINHAPTDHLIGLHVSASQDCKRWPLENWRELIQSLRDLGCTIRIFGAPPERDRLLADFSSLIGPHVDLVTESIDDFFISISKLAGIVCLDSFAVHVAYAIDVPCVMINGPNPAAFVSPPGVEILDGGAGLSCAPCMGKPSCVSETVPYQCLHNSSVMMVIDRLRRLGAIGQRPTAI